MAAAEIMNLHTNFFDEVYESNFMMKGKKSEENENIDTKNVNSTLFTSKVNNNTFVDVTMTNWTYGIYSDYNINDTLIKNGKFDTMAYGVVLGENIVLGQLGQDAGPTGTTVQNSVFDEIARNAIWVKEGTANSSIGNTFNSVGNNNGTEASSAYAVMKFEKTGNTSTNDFFKRFNLFFLS